MREPGMQRIEVVLDFRVFGLEVASFVSAEVRLDAFLQVYEVCVGFACIFSWSSTHLARGRCG
jgi:hypothetical protein